MIDTAPVMPLDDPAADLARVGGKGAALARLARAGLPVPPGFHVTTDAYREFLAAHHLDAPTAESIMSHPVPETTARAIREACAGLGDVAVAVRSSATAEDLPAASFAGQQESYLDVRGADAVVDAVRRCWASLWSDRAVAYRSRAEVDDVAVAVVVQELVDADAAGVAFTANPVTGARDEVLVDAAWGLGEAVVGGAVTPDTVVVDRASGTITRRETHDKTVMTVRTPEGTRDEPVPADRRRVPVLTDAQVAELVTLGTRAQALFGVPIDMEWARAGARIAVLQARPITNLPPAPLEVWNDSLTGDFLWTNGNVGEAVPGVMTPSTWSLVQEFMSEAMSVPGTGGHPICGTIGGRFYVNLSVVLAVASAVGISGLARRGVEQSFGRLPADVEVPPLPMARRALIADTVRAVVPFLRRVRTYQRGLDERLAEAPIRAARLHEVIAATTDAAALRALWAPEVDRLLRDTSRMLAAGARLSGAGIITVRRRLARLVPPEDLEALLSGVQSDDHALASLGPVLGLAALRRGEIDRDTYARTWGHRCPDEFEISAPRPAEDPAWLDRLLAGTPEGERDPAALVRRQAAAREAARERFGRAHPRRARRVRGTLDRLATTARAREAARSEVIRAFGVLRAFVLRAGELTGDGDDLFFLRIEEILAVLDGDRTPLDAVDVRRRTYAHYRALGAYPTLIRGAFDPEHPGAARPGPSAGGVVTGFPGAAGVVDGTVRVLADVTDGEALAPGEILVTTVTNIGWTPLFPRAGAVVTDIGAPLSHAAIVARELGLPAVVGCGDATTVLHTGDRVRVDGTAGTVTPLTSFG